MPGRLLREASRAYVRDSRARLLAWQAARGDDMTRPGPITESSRCFCGSGRRRKHRVRRQCPALTPYRSREKAAATTRSPTGSEAARAAHRRRSFCQHLRRPRELYGARTGGALRVACGQQRSRKPARRQHEAPQLVRPGRKAWEFGLGWGPLATLIIRRSVVCSETLGPLAGTVGAVGRCGGDTAAAAPCTRARRRSRSSNLVDPASSHTLVSKIKPCTSK